MRTCTATSKWTSKLSTSIVSSREYSYQAKIVSSAYSFHTSLKLKWRRWLREESGGTFQDLGRNSRGSGAASKKTCLWCEYQSDNWPRVDVHMTKHLDLIPPEFHPWLVDKQEFAETKGVIRNEFKLPHDYLEELMDTGTGRFALKRNTRLPKSLTKCSVFMQPSLHRRGRFGWQIGDRRLRQQSVIRIWIQERSFIGPTAIACSE